MNQSWILLYVPLFYLIYCHLIGLRIYYAFGMTKILYHDNTESDTVDSLPILMAYGRASETGDWVGDIIGVSDEKPEGYTLMDHIYCW